MAGKVGLCGRKHAFAQRTPLCMGGGGRAPYEQCRGISADQVLSALRSGGVCRHEGGAPVYLLLSCAFQTDSRDRQMTLGLCI